MFSLSLSIPLPFRIEVVLVRGLPKIIVPVLVALDLHSVLLVYVLNASLHQTFVLLIFD